MLTDEQKKILLKTIKHKRLAKVSGVMLALTIILGFATRTFKLNMSYFDINNIYTIAIFGETLILALAFGIHIALYNNYKNDAAWDFMGTKDLDGNVNYKELLKDNNLKAKLPILQILLLSFVFITNAIAINPVKLTNYKTIATLERLEEKGLEDGYYITKYDYPSGVFGITYCICLAPNSDLLYRTDFSIYYNEKNKLDSIRYVYSYDNNLSEEENLAKANEYFEGFKDELEAFIDEGILEENEGTKYYTIDKSFIEDYQNQDNKEYYSAVDNHNSEGYNIICSRYCFDNDTSPSLSISIMY